jgi:hypothetical protein
MEQVRVLRRRGEVDTASPTTLATFINDTLRFRPGRKAALVMIDHGAAYHGFGRDEHVPDHGGSDAGERGLRVCWKAVTSKADPRRKQDWILKCLQGLRAHPFAACRLTTLCCSPPALLAAKTCSLAPSNP